MWDFPRPMQHSVGIGVPLATFGRAALDEAIAQYRLAETRETDRVEHRGAVIATSQWKSGRFEDLGGRDFALLGDAAGLADPATGEGIDYALRSATIAVRSFDPGIGFERYPHAARAEFATEMRRARLLRDKFYRPGVAERLVRRARRSPRGVILLGSLLDAANEHSSLAGALMRGLISRAPATPPSDPDCDCPSDVVAASR